MENLDQSNNKNVSLSLISEYGASDSDSDDTETQSNTGNEDSDAAELSEMVLKNNIINACAHGPLARASDREDGTRHMIIDSCESGVVEYEVTEYRDVDSETDTSDSSDSEVDSVKDAEEVSSGDEENSTRPEKLDQPRVQGELGLDDLPPIEDLAISLPAQETHKIGTIVSIVDRLVIVRAFPETPAVDLDSILFLDNGAKALGKVFDVFGPVTEPHYCVRFNSAGHARERGAAPGLDVYIAPRSDHTSYVFLSELMKVKGSDASWLHDVEPPPHQIEFSDDEEERKANRARKEQRQNKTDDQSSESGEPSRRKPPERRVQRPSESSSRFGGAPPRGVPPRARNPFAARRGPAPPRAPRPWPAGAAPARAERADYRAQAFPAPPAFSGPPMFPPPFNPHAPPPFLGGAPFLFGSRPPLPVPPLAGPPPPFRSLPPCGAAPPPWLGGAPPPPPGT